MVRLQTFGNAAVALAAFATLQAPHALASPSLSTVSGLREVCHSVLAPAPGDANGAIASGGACLGYMTGVTDTYRDIDAKLSRPFMCYPSGTSAGRLAAAFLAWADKHPERGQMSASHGVLIALNEAWPCPAMP